MEIEKSFSEIKNLIDQARNRAVQAVNVELVTLYWNIGKHISGKLESATWGDKTVERLSEYLSGYGPDYKGFNRRNLYRMKQFYETYRDNEFVSPLVAQLSWTNHLLILSKTQTAEEREFYVQLAIEQKYSKRELSRQLDSALYERNMLSRNSALKAPTQARKMREHIKDQYIFEFLGLPEDHSERELQKNLIKNLKLFLLELGRDFLFIDEEYKVQVGMNDYFIDLLFFHRELQCLVAFELKITDFMPEYLGKLNFYLEALDRDVKRPHENPSIGVLLCKGKNSEVVEYAMSRSLSPTLVSEYSLKLPDKKLLQQKLHELYENAEVPEYE